jgi:hypothetical protein
LLKPFREEAVMNEDLIKDCAAVAARHIADRFGVELTKRQKEDLYEAVREYVQAGIEAYAVLGLKSLTTPCPN